MSVWLYLAQRLSAIVMAPLVIGHIILMIVAVQSGLTAGEILGRTQGSWFWAAYYGLFVAAVSVDADRTADHRQRNIPVAWPKSRPGDGRGRRIVAGLGRPRGVRGDRMMLRPHRNRPLWWAFALHRVSGLLLAVFLPIHFYALGLALDGAEHMDSFLAVTAHPAVKAAEFDLVFLLAVHFFGGLRLLALEFLPWRDWQKSLAAAAAGLSIAIACLFLLSAV